MTGPVDRLSRTVGETFSYAFLAAVVITFYEVISRYVFNAPTIWAHESTITLTGIAFVLGGAYTMQRREHIVITVLHDRLPARIRHILDIVTGVITIAYLSALAYAGAIVAGKSWAVMETSASAWNMPIPVVLKTALAVGSVLMIAQGAAQLRQLLARKSNGDRSSK